MCLDTSRTLIMLVTSGASILGVVESQSIIISLHHSNKIKTESFAHIFPTKVLFVPWSSVVWLTCNYKKTTSQGNKPITCISFKYVQFQKEMWKWTETKWFKLPREINKNEMNFHTAEVELFRYRSPLLYSRSQLIYNTILIAALQQ